MLSPFPAKLAGERGKLTLISADQNSALADQNMWGRVKTSILDIRLIGSVDGGLVSPPHVLISTDQQGHFSDQC